MKRMKTVGELIEELQKFPKNDFAAAYSAEETGIVIYPSTREQDESDFDKTMNNAEFLTEEEVDEALRKVDDGTSFIGLPFVENIL